MPHRVWAAVRIGLNLNLWGRGEYLHAINIQSTHTHKVQIVRGYTAPATNWSGGQYFRSNFKAAGAGKEGVRNGERVGDK